MPASAYIKHSDSLGTLKAIYTGAGRNSPAPSDGIDNGYLTLVWTKIRNGIDLAEFVLNYQNPSIANFVFGDRIEVVRSWPERGITDYVSFVGIYQYQEVYANEDGVLYFRVRAYGLNSLLARRINAYYAGLNGRASFVTHAAETFFKTIVDRNLAGAAPSGVADGRDRNSVQIMNFATNLAGGNVLNVYVSRDNVLEVFQKYAGAIAGGDFAVTMVSGSPRFDFYPNQLGTNRSATIVFSLERANMRNPKLTYDNYNIPTVAIVGGKGEGIARIIRVRTLNYTTATDTEIFVDHSNVENTAQLDLLGDTALREAAAKRVLEYDVIQTERDVLERDYFLGDRVTAIFAGYTVVQIVNEITFTYAPDQAEQVGVRMVDAW